MTTTSDVLSAPSGGATFSAALRTLLRWLSAHLTRIYLLVAVAGAGGIIYLVSLGAPRIAILLVGLLAGFCLVNAIWSQPAYLEALLTAAPMVPTLASVCALAVYLAADQSGPAFGIGTALAFPLWLVAALVFQRIGTVQRASPSNYDKLATRLTQLHACYTVLCHTPANGVSTCQEVHDQLLVVDSELGTALFTENPPALTRRKGNQLRWLLATGYSDLWARLHRAEEALIPVTPRAEVLSIALEDEQRLQGSAVPSRATQLKNIRRAAADLDRCAAVRYLEQPPLLEKTDGQATAGDQGAGAQATCDAALEAAARAVVRSTRRVINDFRDDRFDGLLQARNRLYQTGMFTALIAYLLLGVAIVSKVPTNTIAAATVFYLIGALIGLFNRLGGETDTDTASEDYGLSTVRLLYTPLFSGLAALGGVMLVALIPNLAPGTSGQSNGTLPTLGQIFNLQQNQMGLVVAAVFGLTPNLLINRLKQQTDRFKSDIKSVDAGSNH